MGEEMDLMYIDFEIACVLPLSYGTPDWAGQGNYRTRRGCHMAAKSGSSDLIRKVSGRTCENWVGFYQWTEKSFDHLKQRRLLLYLVNFPEDS